MLTSSSGCRTGDSDLHERVDKRSIVLLIYHHPGSTTLSGIKTWQIALVTRNLLDCSLSSRSNPTYRCEIALGNLVASLCWIHQKAALLDGATSCVQRSGVLGEDAAGNLRQFSGHGAEFSESPSIAMDLTGCNSDLLETTDNFPQKKVVSNIQSWLSDTCAEYAKIEKWRFAHVTTNEHVVQNLR